VVAGVVGRAEVGCWVERSVKRGRCWDERFVKRGRCWRKLVEECGRRD